MTVNTLLPGKATFFAQADMLSMKPTFERRQNDFGHDALFISNIAIFRSGTYKDSIGEQFSFDKFGIETFMRNFEHLKSTQVFSKPVVRAGHPNMFNNGRLESVIGYITDLRTETRTAPHNGQEYDYLMADLEIIDEKAKTKIESGLWVNRSMEMGPYEDNEGQELSPVVTGVAWVDIPAVEGLNFSKNFETGNSIDGILLNTEEKKMTGVQMPPAAFTFNIGGNDTSDFSRVQGYISDLETKFASAQADTQNLTVERDALKTENTSLKEFQTTVVTEARHGFIDELCKNGRMLESGKDDAYKMVEAYTPDQFESFKKVMGDTPSAPILGTHGNQPTGNHPGESHDDPANFQLETDKSVLRSLVDVGKPIEVIKGTAAYSRVISAEPTFSL